MQSSHNRYLCNQIISGSLVVLISSAFLLDFKTDKEIH
jgi:hypothetical protein